MSTNSEAHQTFQCKNDYQRRLITPAELSLQSDEDPNNPADCVQALLRQQAATSEAIGTAFALLDKVQTKPITLGNSEFVVQFNPGRVRNTRDLSRQAAAKRPCFLSSDRLLPGERCLPFGDFLIGPNPFPVCKDHLTIFYKQHVDQHISDMVLPGLELARQLTGHFVFYNDAEVGASAPDHKHFQAGSRELLPIADDIAEHGTGAVVYETAAHTRIYAPDNLGRSLALISGDDPHDIERVILSIVQNLPPLENSEDLTPRVNLVMTCDAGMWSVYLFPRRTFRPGCFSDPDESKRILVGPAALEMAGIMVAPHPEDYDLLNATSIAQIYRDVSLPRERLIATLHSAARAIPVTRP